MYKLMRYYNQNRKAIWQIILIIALVILVIQLINSFVKSSMQKENSISIKEENVIDNINNNLNSVYVEDNKTSLSGENISSSVLKRNTEIIDEFFEKCNNMDFEGAYDMVSNQCKEEMYSDLESFKSNYCMKIFDGNSKSISIEPWTGSIYKITIKDDMLATGQNNNTDVKQDYITIEKTENDEYKLNINSYLGNEEIKIGTTKDNISITVKSRDTFMEYVIYTFEIENNSDKEILLDRRLHPETIYLQDEKEVKYPAYNTELTDPQLTIESKARKTIRIKFYSRFVSTKVIDRIVFSDVVLNNEEYKDFEQKDLYNTSKILINI